MTLVRHAVAVLAALVALTVLADGLRAHELRPGFLEIGERDGERYEVRFKVPGRGDMRLRLAPRFPPTCEPPQDVRTEPSGTAFIDTFTIVCPGGLTDREVSIDGLARTFTDVLARVTHRDGSVQSVRLTPDEPFFTIAGRPGVLDTARTYVLLGVQHILEGVDHLLFVLVLLLLIRDPWMLIKTITAFTVAHSLTLAAAALGFANAPQTPVEAVVALSIVFAAAEVPKREQAQPGGPAAAEPWVMALAFGLLHGFGFGGALKEIGLPQSDVPLALLSFNLGVEAGQILFVLAVLAFKASLERLLEFDPDRARIPLAYGIGGLAAAWFLQRVTAMIP